MKSLKSKSEKDLKIILILILRANFVLLFLLLRQRHCLGFPTNVLNKFNLHWVWFLDDLIGEVTTMSLVEWFGLMINELREAVVVLSSGIPIFTRIKSLSSLVVCLKHRKTVSCSVLLSYYAWWKSWRQHADYRFISQPSPIDLRNLLVELGFPIFQVISLWLVWLRLRTLKF